MWDFFDFIIYELLGNLIGKFRLSMRPGLTIIIGVICLLVGALLFFFSDTLFSGETTLLYVFFISIILFLFGLVLTVSGVIRALVVKIRGG